MDDPEEKSLSEAREPAMVLFVGVIILLLAFFVLLNQASHSEAGRTRAVLGSVVTSFDRSSAASQRLAAALGELPGDSSFSARLGSLVATQFPLAEFKVTQPGRIFLVQVPLSSMWLEDNPRPSDAGRKFLAGVAPMLSAPPRGLRYDLDARLVAGPDMAPPLAIDRISILADALEESGAPRGTVASGIDSGRRAVLRLIFTVRPAGETQPIFSPEDKAG